MLSYSYSGGVWQAIDDALALLPSSSNRDYDFDQALQGLGFETFGNTTFTCQTGGVDVYARNHARLASKRKPKEIPYDFLCILYFGGSYYRVWIPDLPNVLLFFREIEVRPIERNNFEDLVDTSYLKELIMNTSFVMKSLSEGDLEVIVKSPKPQR